MIRTTSLFLLLATLFVCSCTSNPLEVDTSKVTIDIRFTHLDSLLRVNKPTDLQAVLLNQHSLIPEIIDYQLGYCLRVGRVTDTSLTSALTNFYSDPYSKQLEKELKEHFGTVKKRSEEIKEGFKHLRAHLPACKVPKDIVYLNSFFSGSAFCTETGIAIGLERYLGEKSPSIKALPNQEFYDWIKIAMDERYLERDALTSWIYTHLIPEIKEANMAASMVQWGKILYLTQAAFPKADASVVMRYSEKDYEWALSHERMIWEFLVKNRLIFDKSEREIANWTKEGPFTPGLPEKGPDRLGQFIGFRIVQSYMGQHSVTLAELIQLPYSELLQEYEIATP